MSGLVANQGAGVPGVAVPRSTGESGKARPMRRGCLDHAASKKQEQIVPSVTGKVYNHSKRMKEKRAVLDSVAAELRRIIGEPAQHRQVAMRLAA